MYTLRSSSFVVFRISLPSLASISSFAPCASSSYFRLSSFFISSAFSKSSNLLNFAFSNSWSISRLLYFASLLIELSSSSSPIIAKCFESLLAGSCSSCYFFLIAAFLRLLFNLSALFFIISSPFSLNVLRILLIISISTLSIVLAHSTSLRLIAKNRLSITSCLNFLSFTCGLKSRNDFSRSSDSLLKIFYNLGFLTSKSLILKDRALK